MTQPLPSPIQLLRRYGLSARHRLGQNFLHDPVALRSIADAAQPEAQDVVLEIGSGFGSLTTELAPLVRSVIAVELDEKLAHASQELLTALANVRVICGDILQLEPSNLDLPNDYIVAANIPYYVTSQIIRHLLESRPRPRRIVLTIQDEVAKRICAEPPDLSLLALSVQVFGNPVRIARIPAAAFYPVPQVDSAILRVECFEEPRIPTDSLPTFFRLVRAGFSQKRKMLRNTLGATLRMAPSTIDILLGQQGIDANRRAQTLTLDEWAALCQLSEFRAKAD